MAGPPDQTEDRGSGHPMEARMSDNVHEVMAELSQDHKNMGLCLNLLEREPNRLFADEEPDFELLHDTMTYMTVYPDAVHHPKEDRLYAELKSIRPDLARGFERISTDHRRIAEDGLALRDGLASVDAGEFVKRSAIVGDALRYVNELRGHMQWEELDLFRRCETMARDGHEIYVEGVFVDHRDPLFGKQTEQRFSRLFEYIREALAAERA